MDSLLNTDYTDEYIPTSDIFVLNKLNGNIFSKDSFEQSPFANNESLYNRLITGDNIFTAKLDGYGKSTIVAVSESDSLIGYIYFEIPYQVPIPVLLLPYTIPHLSIMSSLSLGTQYITVSEYVNE